MTPRQFGYELAVIAIICVIGIFLFPASVGPYPAVHGPVTALRAVRSVIKLRYAMIMAALCLFQYAVHAAFRYHRLNGNHELPVSASSLRSSILRC
jgi:hypothetical protein